MKTRARIVLAAMLATGMMATAAPTAHAQEARSGNFDGLLGGLLGGVLGGEGLLGSLLSSPTGSAEGE